MYLPLCGAGAVAGVKCSPTESTFHMFVDWDGHGRPSTHSPLKRPRLVARCATCTTLSWHTTFTTANNQKAWKTFLECRLL